MKITTIQRIKTLFLLFLAVSNILQVSSAKLETIASFKSNYKLMKARNNMRKAEPSAAAPSASSPGPAVPSPSSVPPQKAGDDLPDVPIYFQGWVKYFRYVETGKKPSKFFKNTLFEKQGPAASGVAPKDNYGSVQIPSEKHFFFVIYKDTANIHTSRDNALMSVADSLTIDFIKTIPEDNNYMGGIKDFGKFSEGSCFEVSTVKPGAFFQMSADSTEPEKGLKEIWLICSDDNTEKKQMMNLLIKLKLKKQHELGVFVSMDKGSSGSLNPKDNNPTLSDVVNGAPNVADPENLNDPSRQPQDGLWIILQNWTPCTLKCGGGLQYLQLLCKPPVRGGKPCQGEAIRTRPCNPQPCPKFDTVNALLPHADSANPTNVVEKPIVKIMQISKRPQRYDKCYLKDSDALMVKSDKSTANFDVLPKIPIRLVMNNKSISVYQDETLQTNLMTFMLSKTVFTRVKGDNRCFILNGLNAKAQFCQLDSQSGNFIEEWDYDFNLFKFQCKQKREVIELGESEEKKLAEEYKEKVNRLKVDMVEKKAEIVKEQVENKEEMKMQKKIEQTQAMTLMAIQKELKLEEMLEKEELMKEKEQEQSLAVQIESEKKKNDCLTKTIKEKEIEDQMNMSKANAEDAIQKIKEEAKKQIMVKRASMKKRLEVLRKKNQRKLTTMQNEIVNLRIETAGKVQKYAKTGDQKNCFNPGPLQAAATPKIEEYCQISFPDNNAKFMDCKNPDSFCFVCCESEFGEMHIPEREKCYKEVCETDSSAPSTVVINHPGQ